MAIKFSINFKCMKHLSGRLPNVEHRFQYIIIVVSRIRAPNLKYYNSLAQNENDERSISVF